LFKKTPNKSKKKKHFSAKFCPECGSTDVFWAQGMPQLWSMWECKNCNYHGPVILEDGNLAKKLEQNWKNKNDKNQEIK